MKGKGELVLVVDEVQAIRNDIRTTLESNGFRFIGLGKCEEAWAEINAKKIQPQVLITDLDTESKMGGMELIKQARSKFPEMPIVLISGDDCPDGCSDKSFAFFKKPLHSPSIDRILDFVIASLEAKIG